MIDIYQWIKLWSFFLLSFAILSSIVPFMISSHSNELTIFGVFTMPLILLFFIVTWKKLGFKAKKLFTKEIQK